MSWPRARPGAPARAGLALALALAAAGSAVAADLSAEARRADFAQLAAIVSEQYVYLGDRRDRWAGIAVRYAPRVEEAATADAWTAVLEDALAELRDFHAEVRPGSPHGPLPVPTAADVWAEPDGDDALVVEVRAGTDAARAGIVAGDRIVAIDGAPTAQAIAARVGDARDAGERDVRAWATLSLVTGRRGVARAFTLRTRDGTVRTVRLPAARRSERPAASLAWSRLPDNVGVIRFHNSLGERATVAAFDAALAELRGTRGLVLDLRDTPSGGSSDVALGILGRLTDRRQPYQRHRIPRYGLPDVERNWVEEVAPRGPFTYGAPVVALVGRWTGSMGEGMAIGLDAMRRATVAGTAMAGLAGATETFTLTRTGAVVALPAEQLFHVDGTPRHAWRPPVLVEPGPGPGDRVLARAGAPVGTRGALIPAAGLAVNHTNSASTPIAARPPANVAAGGCPGDGSRRQRVRNAQGDVAMAQPSYSRHGWVIRFAVRSAAHAHIRAQRCDDSLTRQGATVAGTEPGPRGAR